MALVILAATPTVSVVPAPAPTSSGDAVGIAGVLAVTALLAWRAARLFDRLFGPARFVLSIAAAGLLPLLLVLALLSFILSRTPGGLSAASLASLLADMPMQGRLVLLATLVTGVSIAGMTVHRRRSLDARLAKADIGSFE